ncbi:hypothetical protein E1264_16180 [Actinomadura sp. KC216]|nr:hypothetical protein E1264_16180 [Actinomadura sp. KC216]
MVRAELPQCVQAAQPDGCPPSAELFEGLDVQGVTALQGIVLSGGCSAFCVGPSRRCRLDEGEPGFQIRQVRQRIGDLPLHQ